MIFTENGEAQDAEFKVLYTKFLLSISPQYNDVPAFFKVGSYFDNDVLVYESGFTGLAGVFFPHKLYFAFSWENNNNFIAYWGGDPETASYWLVQFSGCDE